MAVNKTGLSSATETVDKTEGAKTETTEEPEKTGRVTLEEIRRRHFNSRLQKYKLLF